jgi:hypothetical protein
MQNSSTAGAKICGKRLQLVITYTDKSPGKVTELSRFFHTRNVKKLMVLMIFVTTLKLSLSAMSVL